MRPVTLGRMWTRIMCHGPAPMTRARSTNARSFTDSVCDRMIRAVVAQLVMPMTMTMTNRVVRRPGDLAVADDLEDDRREDQREHERRQDQEEVRDAHDHRVGPTRRRSRTRCPSSAPMTTVTSVARNPMSIEIRAPWTVRLRTSRPRLSVPRRCSAEGGSSRPPLAFVTVSSGPDDQRREERQDREEDDDRGSDRHPPDGAGAGCRSRASGPRAATSRSVAGGPAGDVAESARHVRTRGSSRP